MPFQCEARVSENRPLDAGVHLLGLEAPEIAASARPGQFVHIRCSGGEDFRDPLLRRPISIHDVDGAAGRVLLMVRGAGRGTRWLNALAPGSTVNLLGPLGRGFDRMGGSGAGAGREDAFRVEATRAGASRADATGAVAPLVFVAGGGIGVAPLVFLARRLVASGSRVEAFVGARDAETLLGLEAFSSLDMLVHIATDDGSMGYHGNVVELMEKTLATPGRWPARLYACGPRAMLGRIRRSAALGGISCQVSLEERMGCGVGACLGCACRGKEGPLRVCADGPVFWMEELSW
ncbi:MAG: dihydroorotate dehydrogenase electron transfer subunit [Firmicutes bacterium]|nr:dihydroorotate dehydrogenase electron transfer subunit [Bacillota bacterium]